MAEKEYIDREAAIEAIWKPVVNPGGMIFDALKTACQEEVKRIHAADVRPVVRGRWEYNPGDNIPYCSECMMPQDSECNFCPNCGAEMEES